MAPAGPLPPVDSCAAALMATVFVTRPLPTDPAVVRRGDGASECPPTGATPSGDATEGATG
jgi:hypothetical protein